MIRTGEEDLSEAALLDFIHSSGGRVKNADMTRAYKRFVNHGDVHLRARYREEFKAALDRIAVVKSENGEKFVVLKKRYRQQMQDRPGPTGQQATPGTPDQRSTRSGQAAWSAGPIITVTEAPGLPDQQEMQFDSSPSSVVLADAQVQPSQETPKPPDTEDEPDKDSGSKSESEQEEECGGHEGSHSVALDPVEKDWFCSAACARLAHLTQLLQQDPALANKKDFISGFTALHWAAKHGNTEMVRAMVDAGADVNTKAHGGYTPLHIAALHGHRHVADLLVEAYGAKRNVRDYSGRFAAYYLTARVSGHEDTTDAQFHGPQAGERRNRKLALLFHPKKKWGSAEDLTPIPEEQASTNQLTIPAFRTRKFSR
ncbi:ankyrin repeat domain-containing protein SOWAHC-like isoform X1 [Denticeps clupeoides]|uniref:ankyrin repeat domain-containing protein SOWAHC-like isoform X1 n=1 Tax=Denticeps clupeoides TaxID=299321 RepID=UPI0010A3D43B|nr:ankyrin repeat domain-containing protein SOWAHC-like isoform X1 [Denticeps clupeoides]